MTLSKKGIDVRETAGHIMFDAFLQDSTGAILATGTTNLYIYEVQSDGTLKSYDFNDNTFKTTTLTTEVQAMTHRTGNNAATNTGYWSFALTTLTGFIVNGMYLARVKNTGASPTDQFRKFQFGGAEGDMLVTSTFFLKVDAEEWKGGTIPAPTVTGVPNVNTKTINDVATTSVTTVGANLGTTQPINFDGAGATAYVKSDVIEVKEVAQTGGDIFGAVTNIGVTSAAMNKVADSRTLTTSGSETGTYTNTAALDGTYHVVTDSAGTVDFYYEATLPTAGAALTGANWVGYVAGVVNTVKVYLYNWTNSGWDQVGSVVGIAGTTNLDMDFDATNDHTGTGANALKVRVRFQATGLTAASVKTDRLLFGYTVVLTPPTNWSSMSIDASGRVDLGKWIGTAPLVLSAQQVQAVVPITQQVDVNTIKTQAVTCGAGVTINPSVGTTTNTTTHLNQIFDTDYATIYDSTNKAFLAKLGNFAMGGGSLALTTGAIACTTITASGAVTFQSTLVITGLTTFSAGVTMLGVAASGATPATPGLSITGGAASTTGGGTAAQAIVATGGAGAASANGAAGGVLFVGGGMNTVASTADGFKVLGKSNGSGMNCVKNGSGSGITALNINGVVNSVLDNQQQYLGSQTGLSFTASTIEWGAGGVFGRDNIAKGFKVNVKNGTGAPQSRIVTGYTDSTGTMTIDRAWDVTPDVTSVLDFFYDDAAKLDSSLQVTFGNTSIANLTNAPTAGDLTATMKASVQASADAAITANALIIEIEGETDGIAAIPTSNPTAAQIAAQVWTDPLSGSDFGTAGSVGKLLKDDIDAAISSRSTYAGADTAGTTTLLSRIGSAITISGGKVAATMGSTDYSGNTPQSGDNFPIVSSGSYGNSALLAAIQNVQNNTFIATSIPQTLERPDSGSASVNISIVFSDETGAAKNLDSGNPIVALVNDAGTDLSSRLGAFSNPATGKYVVAYTSSSSDAIEGLHWDISGTINARLRRMVAYTQIVDTTAVDFTSTDRTNLTNALTHATNADAQTSASAIRADVGLAAANLDTQLSTLHNQLTTLDGEVLALGSPMQAGTVVLSATQPNYAPAKAGDQMALTAGERNAVAAAIMVLANAIENGEEFKETMRVIRAACVGKSDGFPAGPVHFRDPADAKNRITAAVDGNGNRTAITIDVS